ncbi:MAG TPA: twin-arginine translocation signal domain-containing protein, partial [Dehalococcoidia bacterium]|nr:twin-arginine translocation signal domain-containing protein [Dehalococcoidia bacterium]
MSVTRRHFIKGAAGIAGTAAAFSASGIYGLLDALAQRPATEAASDDALPPEQHRILELRTTRESGKTILIPPLHHQV